jgi:hypothetical protein
VTHFYGLFESMYESNSVQPWPVDMNYNDEQDRFGQVARQWTLVKPHGEKWNQLLKSILPGRTQRTRRFALRTSRTTSPNLVLDRMGRMRQTAHRAPPQPGNRNAPMREE